MPGPLYWIDAFAQSRGLRYEPEADERWLRAWEPYTTLKVPFRYEHALHATGANGSISVARGARGTAPASSTPVPTYEGTDRDRAGREDHGAGRRDERLR